MDKVEELIRKLRDEKWGIRWAAAWALVKIGDRKAVELLIKALGNWDPGVRWIAAKALGQIGDQRAAEPLIQALRDEWYVREAAAEALGKIGKPAVEALIQALRDEDSGVRKAAAWALEKIEPEWYKTEAAVKQVPEFIKALEEAKNEKYYREYLKELLKKILSFHKPFLDYYPYLLCTNCMLKAEKRKVKLGLFKRHSYVVCRGCGTARALKRGIKKVIGLIGGNVDDYKIEGDTAYVNLWFEKEKRARNADIDMLLIAESEDIKDENEYDKAIDAVYNVLVNDRTRPRNYVRKIPVIIEGSPPLSIRAKRVLENEFGGIKS